MPFSGSLSTPNSRAGPSSTERSRTPARPGARNTADAGLSGMMSRAGDPPGSPSQETIRSSVGTGVTGCSSKSASCPAIAEDSTPGMVRRFATARPILRPSRVSTSSREAGLWSLHATASGRRSAAVAPENTAPGASTNPSSRRRRRLLQLGLRRDAPLDGELAPESGEGSLLPEEGPARRARVPQHQIVHRPAAGEFGGRQEGPDPEPHHAHPRRAERAGGVDGEPDVPEPFGDEAGIGPASRRVPGGRVVDAKSGPAVADQLMSERTQRPGRIGRLQTHAGADDGDPDGETVVGDVEPGEQRSVRWADPQREGLHRRDSTGLSRQVTRSESPVTLMETSAAWSGSDPTRRAGGRGTAVARLPAATRGGMHRRRP